MHEIDRRVPKLQRPTNSKIIYLANSIKVYMSTLTWFLALITVFITFIGCYRFTKFFHPNNIILPSLIAVGVTISYIILLPYLIFFIGAAVLGLPIVYYWQRKENTKQNAFDDVANKLERIRKKLEDQGDSEI